MNLNGSFLHITPPIADSGLIKPTAEYNDDYDTNNYPTYSDLLLIKPCTDHLLRKFYVKLVLDDGAIYQDSTQIIKLF